MKPSHLASLVGLAVMGAHAQGTPPFATKVDSLLVTATRTLQPVLTLRDSIVITRDELDESGALSLGEVLQRRAGIELRANGGPGQPQSLFIRGAGSGNTLVLVDGMRVGSATTGTAAIENIPLDMIERIEVVKGPLSSLYGSEAAGGVIQIFTRGKDVPFLYGNAGYGSQRERRASVGLTTVDGPNAVTLALGVRKVDAASATNPRNAAFDPDRDPHENGFANLHASHKLWQGETVALDAFVSRSRTDFDAGIPPPGTPRDRNDATLTGARITSSTHFADWWASRLVAGSARDKQVFSGQFPAIFETRQDQAAWINELKVDQGSLVAGVETVRQHVLPAESFTSTRRDVDAGFVTLVQRFQGQQLEANERHERETRFLPDGKKHDSRNTGSVSYGLDWPSVARLSGTYGRGFRAPTFNDMFGPSFPGFFVPNPDLKPEHSVSREVSISSLAPAGVQWKLTGFDNRFQDLIVFSPSALTVLNVASARIRGVEASAESTSFGVHWRAAITAQRPRDDTTGKRLQGRAERYGSVDLSKVYGRWTAGLTVTATGERFDSTDESPGTRLGGYTLVDARVTYKFDRHWSVQLQGSNLADRRYENTLGYDAPRRMVFLNVRFESY